MTVINPREEFLKRVKKMKFVVEDTETSPPRDGVEVKEDQYFDKYATKDMTKTTFNDLMNKVDLVLKNQEVIINLLSKENKETPDTKSVSRRVYKELVSNGNKIQIGCVLPFSQILEFNKPRDIANHSSFTKNLNVYYPEFYVEDVSDNGSVYNLFKPSNDIIEIVDKSKDNYCVTGVLLDNGRVVYYDQYL